jgi:c-di-GMP-binding flagellar brake protein YcgR
MPGGRRDFVKVSVDVPVRFKYLSKTIEVKDTQVHEGHTNNLSGSGLLLTSRIPDGETLNHLIAGEIMLGLNLLLPHRDEPIKALAQLEWIEAMPETPGKCAMGMRFLDMTKEGADEILRYTIRAQITKKVKRGEF